MDWQQITALAIVAATVAVFFRVRFRARSKRTLPGCGCSGGVGRPPSVIVRGRKGERPQVIVKMK